MEDPRETLLSNIDLSKIRVEKTSPIVLLCGGVVKEKERPSDPDLPIYSVRGAIKEAFPNYELFRPEEIQHWQSDAVYQNLMDFEADLASICTVVVIILESAGSIAELGAFSQLEELSEKLIVIKSDDFNHPKYADSFINLGILRYLSRKNEDCVKTYPWTVTDYPDPLEIPPEIIGDIISDIQTKLDSITKEPVFKSKLRSHETVLIYELINRFIALKDSELINYLKIFGIDISKKTLHARLFLLKQFQLICHQDYSDSTFYLVTEENFHSLRLTQLDGKIRELTRTRLECMEFYKQSDSHIDRHRKGAIKRASEGNHG